MRKIHITNGDGVTSEHDTQSALGYLESLVCAGDVEGEEALEVIKKAISTAGRSRLWK